MAEAPASTHEWVSFDDDEEDRTWIFDVTFLLSRWTCIFGRGCQGVLTGPAAELVQGCCSYGAHFTDDDDVARVSAAALTLTADQWQFRAEGRRRGVVKKDAAGDTVTRMAKGACIFLNRAGFPGGAGCALHVGALRQGARPLDFKPNVCWQLPLRREDETEDDGHVSSTIRQWDRRHWGAGGLEFHWWCTESPDAFVGHRPAYLELRDELVELVGEAVYTRVAAYLAERSASPSVPVPHPAVRRPPEDGPTTVSAGA
ncbi:MAG TPA: hypothetical protein VHM89_16110 [Acidimicrobiales bacterium]|nr:hypothetical protein [Acidimicrobiales bacterium]